ncbi:MAG: alpha/beta hydrolase [Pseudomonadota bacterium]
MTIAFVHGVPETAAIWDALRAALGRPSVALSPPGFGAEIPEGFACTSDAYLDWLADEIAGLPGPVDVVGHDWGGIHTIRLAMARPELIRSWTSDVTGVFDPGYRWHDLAQAWQTPDLGEKTVAAMAAAPPEAKAAQLVGAGMTQDAAAAVAEAMNDRMAQAILPLYRGAAQPFLAELGADLSKAAARPGLAVIATEDAYTGGPEPSRRAAERAGAAIVEIEGEGHWWMCRKPDAGARIVLDFIDGLEAA